MAGLWLYILRRILFMIPVFIAVSLLTFFITNAAGDPVQIVRIALHRVTPAQIAALQSYYHTNEPVFARYFYWLFSFLQGDLGTSLRGGTVAGKVVPWIGTTLELQLISLALSLLIGIPLGVYSALKQYSKADITITSIAIFGYSMPTFWLGIQAIILFSLYLKWLPYGGAVSPYPPYWGGSVYTDILGHLILPVGVLTFVSLATFTRLLRANMLEVLRQDFILAARASGLKERVVIYKHALKNAVTPIVTITGISLGLSLAGAPATETVFSWPGLGYAFVQAALALDLPVIQDITMIITIMALIFNLLTDLAYAYLDPRVRLE
jgi:ABC-type dipeptide/oligopeptide/nickel transport system permease component